MIEIAYYIAWKRYYSLKYENIEDNITAPINHNYLIIPDNKSMELIRSMTTHFKNKQKLSQLAISGLIFYILQLQSMWYCGYIEGNVDINWCIYEHEFKKNWDES